MKDNRSLLEDLALESVQRHGLKALSFRTLADEIGIKSSSVHYYFPEKSDLAEVLIARYRDELFSSLQAIELQSSSLKKKISAFITIFERVAKDDRLCLCGMLAAEVEHLSEHNKQLLASLFSDMEKWLTRTFELQRTSINSSLTSAQLARASLSGLEGALLVDRAMGNHRRLKAQKEFILSQLT